MAARTMKRASTTGFHRAWRPRSASLLAALFLTVAAGTATANPSAWTGAGDLAAYDGPMDRLAGIWGSDCADPDGNFLVMNRSHVLDISPEQVYYYPMSDSWLDNADGTLTFDDNTVTYEFQSDEETRQATFDRCTSLPPRLTFIHGEAVSFVQDIPALQEACTRGRSTCVDTFLDMTDVAGTGGLNEADMARLIRIAAYLGAAQDDGTATSELGGNQAVAIGMGPLVANLLIRSYDYDADGQVTPQELASDRGTLFGADTVDLAGDAAEGIEERVREQMEDLKGLMRMFQ